MNKVKLASIFFLLFISKSFFAQFYGGALYQLKYGNSNQSYWKFWDSDYQDNQEGLMTMKKRKTLGVKEIAYKNTDKKGRISNVKLTYNDYGRLLTSKSKRFERKSVYQNDTIETYRYTKYKKNSEEFKKVFNEQGKVLVDERFENGKLVSKTENTYVNSFLVNAKLLHKGKLYEMKYTYNSENKLIKTEFFKKGKLKQSWVYECKPEGQLLASNKKEMISSKCEFREESADGSYAVFTRTIRDGKPFLDKETFSRDSILMKQEYFVYDTILTYRRTIGNNTELKEQFRKGKLKIVDKSVFNEEHKCVEQSKFRKGKLKSRFIYNYDGNGNQTLIERSWKGKLKFMQISKYDAQGNKVLDEYTHRKDRKITSKQVCEFNENGTLKSKQYFSDGKLTFHKEYEYVFK
ncbi:MAG: hypothetical protein ACK5B9_07025 [Flavobacteriia bacterium]|jgi:antitoxin component YwqK of YwqJK toxin-antitoxin module